MDISSQGSSDDHLEEDLFALLDVFVGLKSFSSGSLFLKGFLIARSISYLNTLHEYSIVLTELSLKREEKWMKYSPR